MNPILRRVLGENDDVARHLDAGHAGVPPEGRQYPPLPPTSAGGEAEEVTELELLDQIQQHATNLEAAIGELGVTGLYSVGQTGSVDSLLNCASSFSDASRNGRTRHSGLAQRKYSGQSAVCIHSAPKHKRINTFIKW